MRHPVDRRGHEVVELRVVQEHRALRVLEDVTHLGGGESGVDRDQGRTGPRGSVVGLEHDVRIGSQYRDRVTVRERGQNSGEPTAPVVQLCVRETLVPVDHGRALGKHRGRPVQEGHGTQWLE